MDDGSVRQQIETMRTTLDAIKAANHAHDAAMTAAIEANQAALRLLRDLPDSK